MILGIFLSMGIIQKSDAASSDYYLKIEGVKGESQITNCPDCMKISSWNWGTLNSNYTSDAISQLRVQNQGMPKEFNFTMVTNSVSPQLLQAALSGNHFKNGELLGFKQTSSGGDASFTITFSDILISGYQISTPSTDDIPMDQIIFDFSNANVGVSSQTNTIPSTVNSEYQIPSWIKNNAGWWSSGQISDDEFVKGIQYLIQNGIMQIPHNVQSASGSSQKIPSWIKNNAGWWSSGQISDDEFVKGIQYLITSGIIKLKS
jgi:type VI protein secretion system component Hcp